MKLFVVVIVAGLFGFVPDYEPIDYSNKMLTKTLRKNWGVELPALSEMEELNNEIAGHSVKGKFFSFMKDEEENFLYVGRVSSCRIGGCAAPLDNDLQMHEGEYFDYFVIFNSEIEVETVRVFNYQSTRGHEITAKSWLKQFNGYRGEKHLSLGKDIDGVSGATISSTSITRDISLTTECLKKHLNK